MPRYINVDDLIKNHNVKYEGCTEEFVKGYMAAHNDWTRLIMSAPAIEIEDVRHGHWIVSNKSSWSQCSVCKRHFLYVWDYENADERCRHCGAIMDEPMEVLE